MELSAAGPEKVAHMDTSNFGNLELSPRLVKGVGREEDLVMTIDRQFVMDRKLRLNAGRYRLLVVHKCYETLDLNVDVKGGSNLKFEKPLQPNMGNLDLSAYENGEPKAFPVYVNGEMVGSTPLVKTVPVCSKVEIGDKRVLLPVTLKKAETVKYVYEIGTAVKSSATSVSKADSASTVLDSRDGRSYKTVQIGSRTWMAENLNLKSKGSFCYGDSARCEKNGRLYRWYAAVDACPIGWHLPDDEDFEDLWRSAGGQDDAGKKLKSGTGWRNGGSGVDSYGLTVIPGGIREGSGAYTGSGESAYYWSSHELGSGFAHYWHFFSGNDRVYRLYDSKNAAMSVRCVKNDSTVRTHTVSSQQSGRRFREGSMKDSRDGRSYRTFQIANQTWMAENLNYSTADSWCYDDKDENCSKNGRLYTWKSATKACPSKWHLPSNREYEMLMYAAGGMNAGKTLKSKTGWNDGGNGEDAYGISILPSGLYYGGVFADLGERAYFWSSDERDGDNAYNWSFYQSDDAIHHFSSVKSIGFSVRCIKDAN